MVWSRPLWKDRYHSRVTGLRLFGNPLRRAAQAVDTVRNSCRVGPQPGMVYALTVYVPEVGLQLSLRVMSVALRSIECGVRHVNVGWYSI